MELRCVARLLQFVSATFAQRVIQVLLKSPRQLDKQFFRGLLRRKRSAQEHIPARGERRESRDCWPTKHAPRI